MNFVKLAPFLAALVLAGCETPPPPAVAVAPPPAVGLARGIDLPTDASDVLGQLKGSRIDFVARYYRDAASRWPTLTASEVQRIAALGLKIVTVWESHSHRPDYFSYASGYGDALNAYRQAKAVAQPSGSAIYFAVDFNARGPDLAPVDQYFRGVAAGFAAAGGGKPEYKVGVYGSGAVCDMVKGARLAQYSWLSGSTAWEGSPGYANWSIRQIPQGARFANLSFSHDANEAKDDYGGFSLSNAVSALAAAPAAVASAATAAVNAAAQAAAPPPAQGVAPAPQPDRSLAGLLKTWF